MYDSVQAQFRAFNEPFEGSIPYMYLDIKGLVTVGVGNLIDPVDLATALSFRFKDRAGIATPGAAASQAQITAEWRQLKSNTSLAQKGYRACEPLTQLTLPDDALNDLIARRLADNESFLTRQEAFGGFDEWPADAQMALLSMAWAMGPAGPVGFPHFCAACENLDFNGAAAECKMSEVGNPGLIPRNVANKILLMNAAVVLAQDLDPSVLYYPTDLTTSGDSSVVTE